MIRKRFQIFFINDTTTILNRINFDLEFFVI